MAIPTFSEWLKENTRILQKAPRSKHLGGEEYGKRIRNRQSKPSSPLPPPPSKHLGGEEYGDRIRKAHGHK
jgi:hypothetical protein